MIKKYFFILTIAFLGSIIHLVSTYKNWKHVKAKFIP